MFIRYSGKKVLVTYVYFGIGDFAFAPAGNIYSYICMLLKSSYMYKYFA